MSEMDIALHGDILERTYTEFIRSRIPNYETTWKKFIGHDGHGRMPVLAGLAPSVQEVRTKLAENHYTILESLILMKQVSEDVQTITDVRVFIQYQRVNINLIAFFGLAGRIRDCVKRIGEAIGDNELQECLQDVYLQRHIVLHGTKVPFELIDGILLLPRLQNQDQKTGEWNCRQMKWQDMDNTDREFLTYLQSELLENVINSLNSVFSRIVGFVNTITTKLNIRITSQMYDEPSNLQKRQMISSNVGQVAVSASIDHLLTSEQQVKAAVSASLGQQLTTEQQVTAAASGTTYTFTVETTSMHQNRQQRRHPKK